MDNSCVNHPDRPATHACAQCGAAICFDCMEFVRGKHFCTGCEADDRKRAAAAAGESEPMSITKRAREGREGPKGPLPAIAYGLIAGFVAAFLWEKLAYLLHVQFFWINIALGAAVGVAVVLGTQAGGIVPGIIGCVLSLATVFLGHWMLADDLLAAETKNLHLPPTPLTMPIFVVFAKSLGFTHWLFAIVGVAAGTLIPWKFKDPPKQEDGGP